MSVTLEVSKLVKSKLVRLRQPSNILDISVTLEVSKLVKSRWVRLPQLLNTPYMSVTAEVSKQDRSRPVRLLQPSNMPLIRVTLEVTKQFPKLIVFRFTKPWNSQEALEFGAIAPSAATYRSPLSIHAKTLLSPASDTSQALLGTFCMELWKVRVFTSLRIYRS